MYKPTSKQEKELRQRCLRMMDASVLYYCGPNTDFMTGRMNELSN